jgi:hypothetical protein
MNHDPPIPPETVRQLKRNNRLWLLILPPLLALSLVSIVKPAGRSAFAVELAIICLCSFSCGFALAIKSFKTSRQHFWGGLFFSGSSLYLISCVVFLGCIPLPQRRLSPAQIEQQRIQMEQQRVQQEARAKANVASHIAPRDALADSTMLDLSPFYDAPLGFRNSTNVRSIAPGTHVWNGVKFDVRAKIQLSWHNQQGVKGIPVGQKCSELYFLHGTEWGMPSSTVSRFVVHFAGTNAETIPMVFGRDLASEFLRNQRGAGVAPTNMVVWQELISTNGLPQPLRGFFVSRWSNPFPDQPVETIDFEPGQNGSSAFLAAITVKPVSSENK